MREATIIGDGNCFFSNITYFYILKGDYYLLLRRILVTCIEKNKTKNISDFPQIEIYNKLINTIYYIPKRSNNKNYSNGFEIWNFYEYIQNRHYYLKDNIAINIFIFINFIAVSINLTQNLNLI